MLYIFIAGVSNLTKVQVPCLLLFSLRSKPQPEIQLHLTMYTVENKLTNLLKCAMLCVSGVSTLSPCTCTITIISENEGICLQNISGEMIECSDYYICRNV